MKIEQTPRHLVPALFAGLAILTGAMSPDLAVAQESPSPHAALEQLLASSQRAPKAAAPAANTWMVGLDGLKQRYEKHVELLSSLQGIDRAALSSQDKLEYDRFEFALKQEVDAYRHRKYLIRPTTRNGIRFAARTAQRHPFDSTADYESWIARLRKFGAYMDKYLAILKLAVQENITQPQEVIQHIRPQIEAQIVTDPEKSPFYNPFRTMPSTIPVADQDRLRAAAREVIAGVIVPAYEKYLHYFTTVYLPHARPKVGLSTVPDGRAMYASLARFYTTTDLTPAQIHAIGLKKVAQLRSEMERVMKSSGFKGSYAEYLEYLRSSPQMYYKNADQMLEGYRAAAKRVDPLLVKLFPVSLLPRVPYGVQPIAGATAQDGFFAYAVPPARDGSVAGFMGINLAKATKRARFDTQVLTCHEARPGHELEIPIAMEAAGRGNFRRYGRMTAFIEGWALYAETLCDDLGLYKTVNQRFAYLNYQMWRAVRLVVDTGTHTMGWTRQQAIDYFKDNSSLDMEHITNEVDRYITNPGQALAYMIGEQTIEGLRAKAEQTLGPKFDVKAFHCAVLRHGELPLSLLSRNVNAWIDTARFAPAEANAARQCHAGSG